MPPHILHHHRPRIADVQCSRLKFEPGDRILVRTYVKLDNEQKKKLMKSIKKFAGCDVEIFIIPCLEFDIEVNKRTDVISGIDQG